MAYTIIDPTRYDAESPITESLMTDIIENIMAIREGSGWTELTGLGAYPVPTGATNLQVCILSAGGGGASGAGGTTGVYCFGGMGGTFKTYKYTPSAGEISSGISYANGAGGAADTAGGQTTFGTLTMEGAEAGRRLSNTAYQAIVYYEHSRGREGFSQYIRNGAGHGTACGGEGGAQGAQGASAYEPGGGGGGGGATFFIDSTNFGDGGQGGSAGNPTPANGANATGYGAGGGGGGEGPGSGGTGGSGSAGIIFVRVIS